MARITQSLYATLYLAKFDRVGFKYLGTTTGAFWLSFTSAFIVLPFFIILGVIRFKNEGFTSGLGRYLSLDLCSYALSWLAFPVLMEYLSHSLNCRKNFLQFLVAYNWSMVPQNILYVTIILLASIDAISPNWANNLTFLLLMWIFAFTWFVTKEGLDVPNFTALGIVIMDFFLGLVIEITTSSRF